MIPRTTTPAPRLWIWLLWLGLFYAGWSWIVFAGARWSDVVAHWPIALAMAAGSYVAGSTPMGGGTVGFPILVLLFEQPASLGRDFSFAVQSIGMTSASIFIFARRLPLATDMLRGAMLGTLVGTPIGIAWIAPFVSGVWIKLAFAVVWASFGVLHLYRINEIAGATGSGRSDRRWDFRVGLVVGLTAGATVASVTGVGIDMVLYATLVLLCRTDLKVAIPTSVVIMAATSLIGIAWKNLTTGLQPGVFENWLAAAPIVALGAPLGVFVVNLVGRKPTLLFVAVLCVGQFVWTCYDERASLGLSGTAAAAGAVLVVLLGFERLRSLGMARFSRRSAVAGSLDAQPTPIPVQPGT
ncbi:sulfite exporter TauE/SafE family protein [Congregicoccus parvus]|uniref:sulfite exporter TauE/SafE family protein n=1 Tax=Congregicoccus parvus TaxID=3081749 RepID=UPI003FA5A552